MLRKKIRVLIVDDSLLFREMIAREIDKDDNIEVVAKAADPFEARDRILEYEPDVMTCDVEMPKMKGIEFIRRLLPQYKIPVIVVSSLDDIVFDAMDAGAVDFVAKPNNRDVNDLQIFMRELISKIKIASTSHVSLPAQKTNVTTVPETKGFPLDKLIAIGASTGGTEALASLLMRLPSNVPGILIVQHIPPVFSGMFAERLNNQTAFVVKEAEHGEYVESGKVLIAPGDQHIRLKKVNEKYKVEVFSGEKINGHCPSVDVLFDSVAKEAGSHAIGVILTGMGYDGAKGLLTMRRKGARTIGQDEKSCVVYGMPKVANDIGAVEKQVPLLAIHQMIVKMLKQV